MELGTESAFQREAWPFALALIVAGVLSFLIGVKLNSAGERRLVDPETNEEVVVSSANHSLFFLKMHWWGPILFIIAAIVFL